MKLSELLFGNEHSSPHDADNIEVSHIETEVKSIKSNTLFIFNKSSSFDITNIVDVVLQKRPIAIICDQTLKIPTCEIPIFRVSDTRKATALIYSRFYKINYSSMKFIGITGTNGKSTTAFLVSKILSFCEKKVGFIGTGKIEICGLDVAPKNYSMTTPDPKLLYKTIKEMEKRGCEYIVMEVSSHALFYKKTFPIRFEICAFTNLSPEHMDFHSNMSEYYTTKLSLFENTKIGIFNMDDTYSRRAKTDFLGESKSIGIIYEGDYRAKEIQLNGLCGSEYIFSAKNFIFKAKTYLPGAYNIYNTMMAMSIVTELGIRPCEIKKALLKIRDIAGKFEIIKTDITVVIDYAHTIEAYNNLLKTIKSAQNLRQKLISVFGCGGNRDKKKRPEIAKIVEKYCDYCIVTEDNSRSEEKEKIIEDILKGFKSNEKRMVIPSRSEAIEYAILNASREDTVAIIGKGHEKYTIDENGYHDFDEKEIIQNALKKRKRRLEKKHEN